jgi:hypothetical protein
MVRKGRRFESGRRKRTQGGAGGGARRRLGMAPLTPHDSGAQARLWDRVIDGQVATAMQKIVGDALRPNGRADPEAVVLARASQTAPTRLLEEQLETSSGSRARRSPWPTTPPRPRSTAPASCTAGTGATSRT